MTSHLVKIIVELERDPDEPSFPPISAESLNATPTADGSGFVLENTPFFAAGMALGDLVTAAPIIDAPDKYQFLEIVRESGAKALSIIFLAAEQADAVLSRLQREGCYCEYGEFGAMKMLAVSVPQHVDYERIRSYLESCENRVALSFAELAV